MVFRFAAFRLPSIQQVLGLGFRVYVFRVAFRVVSVRFLVWSFGCRVPGIVCKA